MKLGVVHNLKRGGAHRRLRNQVEEIRRLDVQVSEFCLSSAEPVTEEPDVVRYLPRAPRVPAGMRPVLRYVDFASLMLAWRAVTDRIAASDVDAVLVNPCQFLQTPPLVGDAHDRPLIYFCDEPRRVDYDPVAQQSRRRSTKILYGPLYRSERVADRRAVSRMTALATNSMYSRGQIELAYGVPASVIAMGVPPALTDGRIATGDSPSADFVLSVGTLISAKGHDLVIAAAGLLSPSLDCVVVAPRGDELEEFRLQTLADQSGVGLTIEIGISDQALSDRYAQALATAYVAAREPLGLVSLEAQAAGCPVVVSNEGGLPETVEDGVTGWAVAREPQQIADRLARLRADHGLRGAMSQAARRRGSQFTWARSAHELLALARQNLEGRTS